MSKYSQLKAMGALIKASLRSITKSPSSLIFTLAFPLIFILVFGVMGDRNTLSIPIAINGSDSFKLSITSLLDHDIIKVLPIESDFETALKKGKIDALVSEGAVHQIIVTSNPHQQFSTHYIDAVLKNNLITQSPRLNDLVQESFTIDNKVISGKVFQTIDFILPGQLGFALLAASVFGTAFVFFSLRQTLVLKRFFATPVKRSTILVSEGIARMSFQIIGAIFIIGLGAVVFNYTLINGWITFMNMIAMCIIALLVFMSFGFIISGVAKSEATIPPLANIFVLPQFLLAGTFFSIDVFPKWLQWISYAMPLTYFNDALRKIGFDGANLWDVKFEIFVLILWGVLGYLIASRLFKWE